MEKPPPASSSSDDLPELDYENLDLSFEDLDDAKDPSVVKKITSSPDDEEDLKGALKKSPSPPQEYILGTLVVRVVAAHHLDPADKGGLGIMLFGGGGVRHSNHGRSKGSANPYASVRFGKTTQRTSEVFDSLDPIWPRGETMYMDVTHPAFPEQSPPPEPEEEPPVPQVQQHPGDPPKKNAATKQSVTRAVAKAKAESSAISKNATDPYAPEKPVLTIALFHASEMGRAQKYNPSKGGSQSGDSDDVFLGMAAVDLTQLLTGKLRTFDQWLPLSGTDSERASVRIVAEYESADAPPHRGDLVRFTKFCHTADLYPARHDRLYTVEECDHDNVLVSTTSAEGWVSSFVVHRYMLVCEERHQGAADFYHDEFASITERLAHSPLVSTVQGTVQRVPEEGLVSVSVEAFQGGASLLNRWLEGGLGRAVEDLAFATNWDGRFNPTLSDSLSAHSLEDSEGSSPDDQEQIGMDSSHDSGLASIGDISIEPLPNMPSCPITGESMRDPVVAADGHTYERSAIARWLKTSDKSPLTGSVLPHKNLVPNYMLLSSLQEDSTNAKEDSIDDDLTEEEIK